MDRIWGVNVMGRCLGLDIGVPMGECPRLSSRERRLGKGATCEAWEALRNEESDCR